MNERKKPLNLFNTLSSGGGLGRLLGKAETSYAAGQ